MTVIEKFTLFKYFLNYWYLFKIKYQLRPVVITIVAQCIYVHMLLLKYIGFGTSQRGVAGPN